MKNLLKLFIFVVPALFAPASASGTDELTPYAKVGNAEAYKIHAFEIEWHGKVAGKNESLVLLSDTLRKICSTVNAGVCEVFRQVTIVFKENANKGAAGQYLGNQITIFRNQAFREDPLHMIFHELAHAYDEKVVRSSKLRLDGAYEFAMKSGAYGKVDLTKPNTYNLNGSYVTSNPQEYFAELSCAYFFGLTRFPQSREILKKQDRKGYDLIEAAWAILE